MELTSPISRMSNAISTASNIIDATSLLIARVEEVGMEPCDVVLPYVYSRPGTAADEERQRHIASSSPPLPVINGNSISTMSLVVRQRLQHHQLPPPIAVGLRPGHEGTHGGVKVYACPPCFL